MKSYESPTIEQAGGLENKINGGNTVWVVETQATIVFFVPFWW